MANAHPRVSQTHAHAACAWVLIFFTWDAQKAPGPSDRQQPQIGEGSSRAGTSIAVHAAVDAGKAVGNSNNNENGVNETTVQPPII